MSKEGFYVKLGNGILCGHPTRPTYSRKKGAPFFEKVELLLKMKQQASPEARF